MKSIKIFAIASLVGFGLASCNEDTVSTATGDWIKESDLDGAARHAAVGFDIANKGYVGLGSDEDNKKLLDFWEYNPATKAWKQLADFKGAGRTAAVGFSANNKGYVGTGLDVNEEKLKDFWEYDPAANKWTRKADFEGTARRNAVAFTINNIGYVGTGFDDSYLKDFYAYNANTNTWKKTASIGGTKRLGAASFVIDGKAYVGTGNNNGTNLTDFWMYDPATDIWTEKLSFTDATITNSSIARSYGVGFSVNGKGFFALGTNSKTVWKFDPTANTWEEVRSFEGTTRTYAVAWSINNKGYITTGSSGTYRFDDIWSFTPDVEQVDTAK